MKSLLTLILLAFFAVFFACKEDPKDENPEMESTEVNAKAPTRKVVTESDEQTLNSILPKLMNTQDAKMFMGMLVSAEMTDMLRTRTEPFTVFVPSNEAFGKVPVSVKDNLLQQNNKEQLKTFLQHHMVEGKKSSSELFQEAKAKGSVKLTTLEGATLTVQLKGSDLQIKDESGVVATLGKTDIEGENATVHILDAVLVEN